MKAGVKGRFLPLRPARLLAPRAHRESSRLEDFPGLSPRGKIPQHIRADQKEKLRVGIGFFEIAAGEIGVACSAAGNFVIAYLRFRTFFESEAAHREAVFVGRKRFAFFVRRGVRGHDEKRIEFQTFHGALREPHVFYMRRIERASENCDFHILIILHI